MTPENNTVQPEMEEYSELMGVKLTPSQKQRIRVAAAYRGTNMSDFVREAALSLAEQDEQEREASHSDAA